MRANNGLQRNAGKSASPEPSAYSSGGSPLFFKRGKKKKIDYKKELKNLYNASAKKVEIVEVPQMNYLMMDGEGDPNTSQAFQDAVEALFSLSYTLKFMIKKGKEGIDYGVMPLEGLWWVYVAV